MDNDNKLIKSIDIDEGYTNCSLFQVLPSKKQ